MKKMQFKSLLKFSVLTALISASACTGPNVHEVVARYKMPTFSVTHKVTSDEKYFVYLESGIAREITAEDFNRLRPGDLIGFFGSEVKILNR